MRGRQGGTQLELREGEAPALKAGDTGGGSRAHVLDTRVRRLTPRECERLQGFPDDWTLIDYAWAETKDGVVFKEASDARRYHAIGNAVAEPVIYWIGRRLNRI